MINKQKAIDEIIENFNWRKVHKTMEALDWTWATSEGKVPTTGALFNCAIKLLHDAYDGAERFKADYKVGTGGFYARATVDEKTKEIYELRLTFEVASWEYDEPNY